MDEEMLQRQTTSTIDLLRDERDHFVHWGTPDTITVSFLICCWLVHEAEMHNIL